jgi:mono/diheme cytochrome c family protein
VVATSRTTRDGVCTLQQADNGKNIFLGSCVSCHTPRDLVGGGFWAGLIGKSVTKFFTYVRENMPQDNPASLSDDDYLATVAYVLQLNGMPPGQAPLVADTAVLTKIKFVAPDSPPHHFSTGR